MQKKIIALAVAAAMTAPALAFADTTVYGILDAAVANVSTDGTKSDTQIISGGLSTSRVGVKAGEDMGNGVTAIANVEYKVDISTNQYNNTTGASTLSARQQMLGLTGNFGTVAAGFLQTTAYDWAVKFNPVEGSAVSPLNNVVKGGGFLISSASGANRASHAAAYISPNFNGFNVAVNYTTGFNDSMNIGLADNAATVKTTAGLVSLNYANGPAAAGFVYIKASNDSTPTPAALNASEYALGGSWDFTVAKLFATYQSNTPSGGSASKAESISATAPAGPGTVVVTYAKSNMVTTPAGLSQSASGETLAYLYDMSKTVTIYGAYSKMSQDNGTAANAVDYNAAGGAYETLGASSSLFAIGLRKKF